MNIYLAIALIIVAFFVGMILGMYLVRKQIEKEFADHPRLNIDAVRLMLSANGQRPSEAKVHQIYRQIQQQQKKQTVENKKK